MELKTLAERRPGFRGPGHLSGEVAPTPGPIWMRLNALVNAPVEKRLHFGKATPRGRPSQSDEIAPALPVSGF